MSATGIVAALGAPLVMTVGFVVWDKHWSGSAFALNLYKCTLASLGFLVLSVSTRVSGSDGSGPFPADVFTARSVGFLMLSSAIGILVGDWTWLEALRLIGARRVIVVDTAKPFLAALFGWAILGEALPAPAFGGMALTVLGVLWVSLEKEKPSEGVREEGEKGEADSTASAKTADALEVTVRTVRDSFKVSDTEENGQPTDDATTRTLIATEQSPDLGVATTHHTSMTAEPALDCTEMKATNEEETQTSKPADSALDCTERKPIEGGKAQTTKPNSRKRRRSIRPRDMRKGYIMAVLNVGLDTYGSLLTKEHGVGMTTWEINLIRFGFASASCLSLSFALLLRDKIAGSWKRDADQAQCGDVEEGEHTNSKMIKSWEDEKRSWYSLPVMKRRSWIKVSIGVLFVTFLCPALSNYALFQIALALALTLGSVGPLYALPMTWLLQNERPTLRSCLGALVAVAGVAILSFFGTPQ